MKTLGRSLPRPAYLNKEDMDKPPSKIKNWVFQLVSAIEQSKDFPQEQKAFLMDSIRTNLRAYLKLKKWINDENTR